MYFIASNVFSRQTSVLVSTFVEEVAQGKSRHAETSPKLGQLIATTNTFQNDTRRILEKIRCPEDGGQLSSTSSVQTLTYREPTQTASISTSQQVRVTMSVPIKPCDATCNCQCHQRTRYHTPRWLSAVVRTLFYSSFYQPSVDVLLCNILKCSRSRPHSSKRFVYYFPTWMIRSALVFSTWSNLDGRNSSWFVRMPRVIPNAHRIWRHIKDGEDEEIKKLLSTREISPFDIGSDGFSLLSGSWPLLESYNQ